MSSRSAADGLEIRALEPDDRPALLRLLADTLPWVPDELFERFFAWKHNQSPFGRSPAWVAVDGPRLVGFRTFVRWEFEHPDGRTRRAVRAVDTATHPEYQGRGIFRRLTLHALDELGADGVDFVFNTPNDKSRPGYLSMGWVEVGRLRAMVRPTTLRAPFRMLGSRVPADRWSVSTSAGMAARDVLADGRVSGLLERLPLARQLRTRRSPEYLRWRYGFDRLAYRAVLAGDDPRDGLAVFRLRRRGSALEAALCELLVPADDPSAALALGRSVARTSGADYVIRLGSAPIDRAGFVRLPGQGPTLAFRSVAADAHTPAMAQWDLSLGDVELF